MFHADLAVLFLVPMSYNKCVLRGRCGIRWKLEKHRDSDVLGVKDSICDNQQTEGYHVVWDGCMQNDHFIDMVYREMLNAHSM
jgi:hypothetical protein